MEMRSVAEMRALLGASAVGKTDAQVLALRDRYYRLAHALVNGYLASRRPAGEVGLQRVDRPRRPRRPRDLKRSA